MIWQWRLGLAVIGITLLGSAGYFGKAYLDSKDAKIVELTVKEQQERTAKERLGELYARKHDEVEMFEFSHKIVVDEMERLSNVNAVLEQQLLDNSLERNLSRWYKNDPQDTNRRISLAINGLYKSTSEASHGRGAGDSALSSALAPAENPAQGN